MQFLSPSDNSKNIVTDDR